MDTIPKQHNKLILGSKIWQLMEEISEQEDILHAMSLELTDEYNELLAQDLAAGTRALEVLKQVLALELADKVRESGIGYAEAVELLHQLGVDADSAGMDTYLADYSLLNRS